MFFYTIFIVFLSFFQTEGVPLKTGGQKYPKKEEVCVQFGGHFGYTCTCRRTHSGVQNFSTFLDTSLEGLLAVLGAQGYPEGDAFGPIFLTFGGPGAFAEIAVSPRRNLT